MIRANLSGGIAALSIALSACSGGAESQAPPPAARGHGRDAAGPGDRRLGRLCRPVRGDRERRGEAARLRLSAVGIHFRDGAICPPGPAALHHRRCGRRRRSSTRRGRSSPGPRRSSGQRPDRARPLAHAGRPARRERRGGRAAPGGPAFGPGRRRRRARQRSARGSSTSASRASSRRSRDRSPSAGSIRGNAVTADQTVLTTIVSTNPLHFAFDGSEALLLRYQRQDGGSRIGSAGPHPASGRGAVCPCRPARFRRQCAESRLGHDPGARRRSQPRRLPEAGHDGPPAAGRLAALSRRCWSPTRRSSPTPRGASSMSWTGRATSPSGRSSSVRSTAICASSAAASARRTGSIIGGIQRAMPGQKVKPRKGRIPPPTDVRARRAGRRRRRRLGRHLGRPGRRPLAARR